MAVYVTRVDLYLHAKSGQEVEERVRDLERDALRFPGEFLRFNNRPQRLLEDGTLAPREAEATS